MKSSIRKEIKELRDGRLVFLLTSICALLSYGYEIMHTTIGIDDTAVERYLIDGWAPQVGRWTVYLLNKVLFVAEFTPFFTDLLGVIFLVLASYLFCVLLSRISDYRINTLSLVAFSCIFITSPFMSEVYIFYLHNAVGLSFLLVAVTGLCLWECIEYKRFLYLIPASVCMSLSIGAYESFVMVYVVLILSMLLIEKLYRNRKYTWKQKGINILCILCPLAVGIVLRTVISGVIVRLAGIPYAARSVSSLKYWFLNNPLVLFKDIVYRFLIRYVLNGEYLIEVRVFFVTAVLFLLFLAIKAVMSKRIGVLLYGLALMIAPWLLVPVQMDVTAYRAAQALIYFVAFSWLFISNELTNTKRRDWLNKTISAAIAVVIMIIAFNQGFQLNRYFYFDHLKEENDKTVCTQIAYEIMSKCDTSKPVVFVGGYEMPIAIRRRFYLPLESKEYAEFTSQWNLLNTKALYEYVDNTYGYRIYDVAQQEPLYWMGWATETNEQLYNYMDMLGYEFVRASAEEYGEAMPQSSNLAVWPKEGSIEETEKYIIVRLGE